MGLREPVKKDHFDAVAFLDEKYLTFIWNQKFFLKSWKHLKFGISFLQMILN